MKNMNKSSVLIFFIALVVDYLEAQSDDKNSTLIFINHFSKCSRSSSNFDNCIRDAINSVRVPYFKTGVPDLNITPFDPFSARQVVQERGGGGMQYKLTLKNVQEKGWTDSVVTKFRSDSRRNLIQYTQFFPEKYLEGEYDFKSQVVSNNMTNQGFWNLTLYNYVQTTTISRPKGLKNLKVYIDVQAIGNMDLHIGNLLNGRTLMEGVLDRAINFAWRPGFRIVRPLINDLVSTAFTEIFNNIFSDFDFSKIIPA